MLKTKSEKTKLICLPRWEGKGETPKVDPCGGCPLYQPCVMKGTFGPGEGAYNNWIDGINKKAEEIS